MSKNCSKILYSRHAKAEGEMSREAAECQSYFCEAVSAEIGDGRARIIHAIARATCMSERRVCGIMRGEVRRIWADELSTVRAWHAGWCERHEAKLRHQAEMMRLRREKIERVA